MDAELKAKWVKALRSGEFKQATGELQDRDGAFCCLGVLARLQQCQWQDVGTYTPSLEPFTADKRMSYPDGSGVLLPRFAGGLTKPTQRRLANMNDGEGKWSGNAQNFEQIADYIEREL